MLPSNIQVLKVGHFGIDDHQASSILPMFQFLNGLCILQNIIIFCIHVLETMYFDSKAPISNIEFDKITMLP
jgi:hypothetical protein